MRSRSCESHFVLVNLEIIGASCLATGEPSRSTPTMQAVQESWEGPECRTAAQWQPVGGGLRSGAALVAVLLDAAL
jgi:hypothetical protein